MKLVPVQALLYVQWLTLEKICSELAAAELWIYFWTPTAAQWAPVQQIQEYNRMKMTMLIWARMMKKRSLHYLLPVCPLSSLSSNSSTHLDQVAPKRASVKGETSLMIAASSNVLVSHVNHIVLRWCVESLARGSNPSALLLPLLHLFWRKKSPIFFWFFNFL